MNRLVFLVIMFLGINKNFCATTSIISAVKTLSKNFLQPSFSRRFASSKNLNLLQTKKQSKPLPIGTADFKSIINYDMLYVDKTKPIYEIASSFETKNCFLSRPRRIGKSLLISTLKYLFLGEKDLFKNTWIYESDWKWEKHPVVHMDMSVVNADTVEGVEKNIKSQLKRIADEYEVKIDLTEEISSIFDSLILKLSKINKVVILIDEYDAPILKYIENKDIARKVRDVLKNFYTVIKSQNALERFVFVTGVTKFSHTSMFSGMNQLVDLTMQPKAAEIVGYTESEVLNNFQNRIEDAALELNLSKKELLQKIKNWYNGYRFSRKKTSIYNPFSIHNFFSDNFFSNYWFSSGSPSLFFELISKNNYNINNIKDVKMGSDSMLSFDFEAIALETLLYQTGYITITDFDPKTGLYTLNFPNKEVDQSFTGYFANFYCGSGAREKTVSLANNLYKALENKDLELFFDNLNIFFASIPYEMHIKKEAFYQAMFTIILKAIGFNIEYEVRTNVGRIDNVITTKNIIYIFEFKLNKSKKDALDQIIQNKYYEKYLGAGKEIILVGANFSSQKGARNIDKTDWDYTSIDKISGKPNSKTFHKNEIITATS